MVPITSRTASAGLGLRSGWNRAGTAVSAQRRSNSSSSSARPAHTPKWRPVSVLDQWVSKEARPVSLRQLMVFGRTLTESRLISSANYVRTELPTRIAHRIRDMQQLPYVVVTNPHISEVYELYYNAFDTFRKIKEIKTLEDNDAFCKTISHMLKAHQAVIPKLMMGTLESSGLMDPAELDKFMNTILKARISRRVIAEQHLSLTETLHAPWFSQGIKLSDTDFIGKVFLKCVARDVVERCGKGVQALARSAYGEGVPIPEFRITGHLEATFPYILSHLEYIIGELLRNAVQAAIEKHQQSKNPTEPLPRIEVTICEAPQHVIIRISDQSGGIPRDMMPYLWSFCKGPHSQRMIKNLQQMPRMNQSVHELRVEQEATRKALAEGSSLSSLTLRQPDLKLGMGLPLSRVYAEYWAGKLELHSLEGYGVDAFLQISKIGNKNEQLTTRATMDAI